MYLPTLTETKQQRETTAVFNGMCHTSECSESELFDTRNMTFEDYPAVSVRRPRKYPSIALTNIKGMLGGEELYVVSTDGITKVSGSNITKISASFSNTEKTLVKMGKYLCVFPDKKVYDGTTVRNMVASSSSLNVTFSLTDARGNAISYHNAAYYDTHAPHDGDYLLTEVNGVNELQRYSSTSGVWTVVTTAYVMATAQGIGIGLNPSDGVKISLNLGQNTWSEVDKVLPIEENGVHYATYPIKDVTENSITFSGIITQTKTLSNVFFSVEREVPNIAFVTEAGNRLWACNADGTELYATKLGDPFNWNCFEGISTDSWAATVGSGGEFTGAITYLGYPTFFKENSLIKIAISASGAHSTKETVCRGVQKNCGQSLAVVNEILYYKSQTAIVAYDGSLPLSVSQKLGDMSGYSVCVAGRNKDNYYIVCDGETYVYDTQRRFWAHEEDKQYSCMATYKNTLVGANGNVLCLFDDLSGLTLTEENDKGIEWFVETKETDYMIPDAKYVHKVSIKTTLLDKAKASVYIKYDDGKYDKLFEMRSAGTRVYPLVIIPRRCDRFQIKVCGSGIAKIHSITKFIETGSDTC